MRKTFYIYRQVFNFKVSYFVISNRKGYIPKDTELMGSIQAPSRKAAADWLNSKFNSEIRRLLCM